jgi:cytochrome b561
MTDRYALPLRALHWIVAVLALCLILAGFALKFDIVPDALHHPVAFIHISAGLTVLLLVLVRLGLRFAYKAPALPESFTPQQRRATAVGQGLIYVLLIAMPVFGVIFIEAHGHAVSWFGLPLLPAFMAEDKPLAHLFANFHLWGGIALVVLIAGHLGALVWHKRQGVTLLPRMWG